MKALELKLPPPVLVGILAAAMWFAARLTPSLSLAFTGQSLAAGALVLVAAALGLPCVAAFRRAGTTVLPHAPERSAALVTGGVYRFSRNPMYLAMLVLLGAWAVHLGNAPALLGLPAFVAWMNRFQIAPEERALRAKFGEAFGAYERRVRRWV